MMLYFPGVKYIGKDFCIYMHETEKLIFKNKTDIFVIVFLIWNI